MMKSKRSILALTGLSIVAASASAQTNVTIYGIFDLGFSAVKSNTAATHVSQDSSLQQGSRLGLKGIEDIGGEMTAEFRLENGFNGDTGSAGQGGRIFGRQAYVGLNGAFGAVNGCRLTLSSMISIRLALRWQAMPASISAAISTMILIFAWTTRSPTPSPPAAFRPSSPLV